MAIDLSTAILQLSENGDLQRIHDKWLVQRTCSLENAEIDSDRLQLKSFWGLYLVCGIACFIALLIYFLRIFLQLRRAAATETSSPGSGGSRSRSGGLQRFLSIIDEKEEQSRSGKKKRAEVERSSEEQLGRDPKRIQTEKTVCFDSNV